MTTMYDLEQAIQERKVPHEVRPGRGLVPASP
jgi:hypothetical protein